jgi:2-dehydro-3-deoxygluconokinase
VSQLRPGGVDWDAIFASEGARWFHCGGIFAALGKRTADVVTDGMAAARRHGTIVSYDLNYRPSLWRSIGGQERAREINRAVAPLVDVMLGNEEDFSAALGFEVPGVDQNLSVLDPERFGAMMAQVAAAYPNIRVVATTLRGVLSASRNDWSAACWADGALHRSDLRPGLEILDRVGGGDSFAAGLIYGLLSDFDLQQALDYGAAHGALTMTTPGDTSMATLAEVEALVRGASARVRR